MKSLLLVTLLAILAATAAPTHSWKTGTLVETAYRSQTTGGTGPIAIARTGPSDAADFATAAAIAANRPRTYTWQGFTINGEGYVFIVMCPVGRHKPNVTVNGPIQYRLTGGEFYIQDEDYREFKMTILQKTLAPALPATATPAAVSEDEARKQAFKKWLDQKIKDQD